ncbi:flagellar hook-associated protein FlgK [Sphingomonas sp. M1-B02]|uniref:flagellar hook-associated protein FlgK n=1 Tax=Sphingomonas sp. M1-B02 TaxID=3114300 RepID=UPI002240E1CD|nr:flagellar hook-associated protein FlgK [Sphingomonas sp. S6-11]UZK65309.1 flagellar hook-associated protein FlgK [Sphingomonas sp. S6-11]
MSDMLSIGLSSLKAYQTALTTTSENIASAGNAGYSRRTTNVREVVAPAGISTGSATGMGVVVNGITRAADVYKTAEVRTASAELAKTETGATWLQRIEQSLTGNQLGSRLTAFFNSAKAVAADPASLAPRAAMIEAASSIASAFAATGIALDGAMEDLDASAGAAATELNGLAKALGRVNAGLGRAQAGSSGQAALLDERDRLLEQMSVITDVSVTTDHVGRAIVRAGGVAGPVLVSGENAGGVTFKRSDEGVLTYTLNFQGESSAMFPNGGVLAGFVEGAQRIAGARDELNTLATDFAEGVNAVQAAGDDLQGDPGAPMFVVGDPASRLTLALSDPRGIAAASTDKGIRDNGNLAGLDSLRGTGKFEDSVASMTSANAAALSARTTVAEAQTAMRDSAIAERAAAVGVNIDEEAVDLLRFQQAYQASSRVIQIARETLQSILEIR